MAKDGPIAVPGLSKMPPKVVIEWDKGEKFQPEGLKHVAMGERVTVTVVGTVKGHAMQDWGNSIQVHPRSVTIAKGDEEAAETTEESGKGETEEPTMAHAIRGMKSKIGTTKGKG